MNAPTLLVGLGGFGCKTIERVSTLVTSEQRNNIAFVAFDTDINELGAIRARSPFVKTIQTSTKQTVGEYLSRDANALNTWFPVNRILNGKTLTEGAGQVRSVSRLALESVIRAGKMEPLHEAIHSLYRVEEDKSEQALRVVIVSSLAGGTGSGLIVPIAMYIKHYLTTHFRNSANITRGFFILPEVFFKVITGETERNNLKANAYATLRELDAFLMKGDATLHERYTDSVTMKLPSAGSKEYVEYNERPYDFCFLFDAQNAEGVKLDLFEQYLSHAANCIYAQSIGPMNSRSNSSEDNAIRKLARECGRNRYAGAGASMLIYPYEDIRSFIALKWAKECISTQWLTFDNMYRDICLENNKKLDQGISVQNPDPITYYSTTIESQAKQGNLFAKAIIKSCIRYSADGVTIIGDRWTEYVDALKSHAIAEVNSLQNNPTGQLESATASISNLSTDWSEYMNAYQETEKYRAMVVAYVEEVSPIVAYSLFKAPKEGAVVEGLPYQLETYLVSTQNEFLHPNAVRYMLGKILDSLKGDRLTTNNSIKEIVEYFNSFVKNTFDDPNTEEEEGPEAFGDRRVALLNRWFNSPTGDQEAMKSQFTALLHKTNEYREQYMYEYVLNAGIEYVESIIKAFERFYKTFEGRVKSLDSRISSIYKKYENKNGITTRYVCASRACLDKLYDKKPYTGGSIKLDSELTKEIYNRMLTYAMMKDKPNNNRYFSELFDKGILGYFENAVMRDYGSEIDIDIITALENEAVFEMAYDQEDDAEELIDTYVRKIIANTRNLSCPFIESPLGEAREPVYACTYNNKLDPNDDSARSMLVKKDLKHYGGVPDEDIPANMIMFYQSFYGLRANDLSKFAPPEKSLTYDRSGGEYFQAYYELVSKIKPGIYESNEISPHIDRRWHIITKMPDLDEDNQKKQEQRIYAAFFWGILGEYIDLFEDTDEHNVYKLKIDALNMEKDILYVSNKSDCDKLYEVLDAIAVYPELVDKILSKIDSKINDEVNNKVDINEGLLYSFIETFMIKEYPLCENGELLVRSLFDIPMLMKKSAVPDVYYEENVLSILRVELEEVKRYLLKFYGRKEYCTVMGAFLRDQFEKYLRDVKMESKTWTNIYRESLFDRTCTIIAGAFEDIGLNGEARKLLKRVAELRQ